MKESDRLVYWFSGDWFSVWMVSENRFRIGSWFLASKGNRERITDGSQPR